MTPSSDSTGRSRRLRMLAAACAVSGVVLLAGVLLANGQASGSPVDEAPPSEVIDACPNLDGDQPTVPDDMFLDGSGACVFPVVPADIEDGEDAAPAPAAADVDVCSNLDGAQATVPDGYVLAGGACVSAPADAGAAATAPDEAMAPDAADAIAPATTGAAVDAAPATNERAGAELPFTGVEDRLLVGLALALILIGVGLELGHRRGRRAD